MLPMFIKCILLYHTCYEKIENYIIYSKKVVRKKIFFVSFNWLFVFTRLRICGPKWRKQSCKKTCQVVYKNLCIYFLCLWFFTKVVATLALSLWPRRGLAKVRTKCEAQESHFMFLGMWESAREWTPHSQMSSHFGN